MGIPNNLAPQKDSWHPLIIADEPDLMVGTGFFGDRTEAVNEALKFLIRLAEQIKSLSKNVKTDMSLTDALMSSRDGGGL